ncbi:MAG: hypothetical protein ACREC1_01105, partial [Methylovirgula sp.]
ALKKTVHAKTPAKTSGSSAGAGSLETLRIDLIFFSKPQNSLVTTPIWGGGHINSMGIGALRHSAAAKATFDAGAVRGARSRLG